MTKVYKTARGQTIDMDKLKLSNESTVSVGNMRVNARGDILGAGKEIAASRNQVMDRVYAVEPGYSPNDPKTFSSRKATMEATSAKDLADLVNNSVVPTTTTDTSSQPAARGSLADSIAKQTSVVQEPMQNPKDKKPSGPSRI